MKTEKNIKLFIWQGRTLYIGPIPENKMHRQLSASCVLGFYDPIIVETDGETLQSKRHFISSGRRHALRPVGQRCALLYFDPHTRIAREAQAVLSSEKKTETLIAAINRLDSLSATASHILPDVLSEIPCVIEQRSLTEIYGDLRIAAVVKKMMSNANERYSVADLASIAGCSESRLSHLFTNEIGVPLRTLRSWLRLKIAAIHMSKGIPTAEAALLAGFYDQAHFSNTFSKIFGIPPIAIFPRGEIVDWFVEAPEVTISLLLP